MFASAVKSSAWNRHEGSANFSFAPPMYVYYGSSFFLVRILSKKTREIVGEYWQTT